MIIIRAGRRCEEISLTELAELTEFFFKSELPNLKMPMSQKEPDCKVEKDYDLAGQVIGLAMKAHRTLGTGFLESIYHKALCIELDQALLKYEAEKTIIVNCENVAVGEFKADLVIGQELIVEIKAVSNLVTAHEVQLVNYLSALRIDEGLLLNFGGPSLEFRKKFRVYRQWSEPIPF
jgi:GxxExxY protein